MKQYKGYYIDHMYFNNEKEIDDFIKESEIRQYKIRCQVFAINKTVEAAAWADEQAQKLNKLYGITWEELERIEIDAYKAYKEA